MSFCRYTDLWCATYHWEYSNSTEKLTCNISYPSISVFNHLCPAFTNTPSYVLLNLCIKYAWDISESIRELLFGKMTRSKTINALTHVLVQKTPKASQWLNISGSNISRPTSIIVLLSLTCLICFSSSSYEDFCKQLN